MLKFPLKFEAFCEATAEVDALWQGGSNGLPSIPCAVPREFRGPGGGYTPTDFFALAQLNCTVSMFKIMCEKSSESFKTVSGRATVIMDQEPDTLQIFLKQIDFIFEIKGASDPAKVKKILEMALNKGPVCTAVKTPKTAQITMS